MKNRILLLVLLVAAVFCLASCKEKQNKVDPPVDDLIVEIEPVEYSEQEIESAKQRIKELAKELISVLGYSENVGDSDIEKLGQRFADDVVPILIDVAVYPEELSELLKCAEGASPLLDENNEEYNPKALSDLYMQFAAIIDADRLGALIYEAQLLALNIKLERVQEKYDKYGYAFYLDDIERYKTLLSDAKEIGRKDFADAISVLFFTASAFNGSLEFNQDSGVSITVADTLAIMKKQGEGFAALTLDGEDWQTVAAICEEFLPTSSSQSLKSKVLLSLNNEDFFIEAADVMPDLIALYAVLASDISKESADLIESGAEYAYARAVCSELVKNEAELREFLLKTAEKIPTATESSIASVKSYDKTGYEQFCSDYRADADVLVNSIKAFLASPTAASYSEMKSAYLGYAASINPVVAFVYLYN